MLQARHTSITSALSQHSQSVQESGEAGERNDPPPLTPAWSDGNVRVHPIPEPMTSADADTAPTFTEIIARLSAGEDLSADDARSAFDEVMAGRASPAQMAGLLVGLRTKGEAPAEVAGGVRALREAMVAVEADDRDSLVDTCGTGGGALTTFNISTAAALLAAGMGVRIAKHGNRSFTSRCGSADVLEELGIAIDIPPEAMAEILAEAGIVFMFAPLLHPAMRHIGPVRRELGILTIMNLLGPLTNPAGAMRQVVGVTDPDLLDLVAHALQELGHHRALVVYGEPGLDELSPLGTTHVAELDAGNVRRLAIEPADFGWHDLSPEDLVGGDPAHNAAIILEVFRNQRHDAARAAVVLNAGAAVYVSGTVDSLEEGVRNADVALTEGAAMDGLERLRSATRRAVASE